MGFWQKDSAIGRINNVFALNHKTSDKNIKFLKINEENLDPHQWPNVIYLFIFRHLALKYSA